VALRELFFSRWEHDVPMMVSRIIAEIFSDKIFFICIFLNSEWSDSLPRNSGGIAMKRNIHPG
jgi:hypothetical protein